MNGVEEFVEVGEGEFLEEGVGEGGGFHEGGGEGFEFEEVVFVLEVEVFVGDVAGVLDAEGEEVEEGSHVVFWGFVVSFVICFFLPGLVYVVDDLIDQLIKYFRFVREILHYHQQKFLGVLDSLHQFLYCYLFDEGIQDVGVQKNGVDNGAVHVGLGVVHSWLDDASD